MTESPADAIKALRDALENPNRPPRALLFVQDSHARALLEHVEALTGVLRQLDHRLRLCSELPVSAAEAYDSFYQHEVAAALAQTGEQKP